MKGLGVDGGGGGSHGGARGCGGGDGVAWGGVGVLVNGYNLHNSTIFISRDCLPPPLFFFPLPFAIYTPTTLTRHNNNNPILRSTTFTALHCFFFVLYRYICM